MAVTSVRRRPGDGDEQPGRDQLRTGRGRVERDVLCQLPCRHVGDLDDDSERRFRRGDLVGGLRLYQQHDEWLSGHLHAHRSQFRPADDRQHDLSAYDQLL